MTVAVYPVGGPVHSDREALRYSLRSLQANAPAVTDVWLVGDIPAWYTGRSIATTAQLDKFHNIRASWTAFVNHRDAPAEHYLFNDDHWIVEPVEGDLPVFHLGKAQDLLDSILGPRVRRTTNTATKALRDTATWVSGHLGVDDVLAHYAHTPLRFDTAKVRDLLAAYPTDVRLEPMLLYPIAGLSGEGIDAGNAKVKVTDSLAKKLAQPMPFLSGNDDTWAGPLGEHVKGLFPEPCRWER